MKKSILKILKIILIVYIAACGLLYFLQEYLIFFPQKLSKDYTFRFRQPFEELHFKTADNVLLNGLLFKADTAKGLIFYLHGNAGSLKSWGETAKAYTDLHYDLFILDYRGYGKSEGRISSQDQLYGDIQMVYDSLKRRYSEPAIIVLGYSIGTGPAAKLASANHPGLLILQAPYYNLSDMMRRDYPVIPTFLLKYKFETSTYIKACRMPVVIFHGDKDEVIGYQSSIKLKKLFKQTDTLITLKGQRHNGMSNNPEYMAALRKILEKQQ